MRAFLLTGPTAVGKTAITQELAEEFGLSILSTDSMQVYRGMDIGTAKPRVAERGDVPYFGIDLVDPDASFSAGDYVRVIGETVPENSTLLATGGTGLYIKALVTGLDELPAANAALRAALEAVYEAEGIEGLHREAAKRFDRIEDQLRDPLNPRRVIRAIELADAGCALPQRHEHEPRIALPALTMDREQLRTRITERVRGMFELGLLDEVEGLRARFPEWSSSAAQAIGYKECLAVLDGDMTAVDAEERISIRTRQYAKRQMTWLNNQFNVTWVEKGPQALEEVRRIWDAQGPVDLTGLAGH